VDGRIESRRPWQFVARFALALLLVVGGATITVVALRHGDSASAAVVPPPASPAPAGPAEQAAPAEAAPAAAVTAAPVQIRIDAIGASAPVDPLGLNPDGTLQTPADYGRAGYFTGRPNPGAVGPAIIVAHVDSKTGPAVFYRLRDLTPGDEITVTRADGSEVVFLVDRLEDHPKDAFPTDAVYGPTPDATLRLITCGGSFDRSSGHYRNNLIAFAHLKA
jgi:sortase (surface protein transpeptidase)